MTLKNLFFDLDGTILESSRGILNSFRYTFDEMGHPQLSDAELNTFIGPPLKQHLQPRKMVMTYGPKKPS